MSKPAPGLPPPIDIPPGPVPEEIALIHEAIAFTLYGRSASDAARAHECLECEKVTSPSSFRTEAHLRAYTFSGLCQECQDEWTRRKQRK